MRTLTSKKGNTLIHKNPYRILALILALLVWVNSASELLAQSYTLGYARYTRGDFKGAIDAFELALSARPGTVDEKVKLYKYLGISWYMLGEKRQAAKYFQTALRLQSELTILKEEVLDETVITLFEKIKTRQKKRRNSIESDKLILPEEPPIAKSKPVVSKLVEPQTKPYRQEPSLWPRFLPLGLGLIHEGKYLAGSLFGVSQVTLLGLYYQSTLDEQQLSSDATFLIQEAVDQGKSAEEIEGFRQQANSLIEEESKLQQTYLAGFAGLWIGSIIYAWISEQPREFSEKSMSAHEWHFDLVYNKQHTWLNFSKSF